jgi:hypothetical protein
MVAVPVARAEFPFDLNDEGVLEYTGRSLLSAGVAPSWLSSLSSESSESDSSDGRVAASLEVV